MRSEIIANAGGVFRIERFLTAENVAIETIGRSHVARVNRDVRDAGYRRTLLFRLSRQSAHARQSKSQTQSVSKHSRPR